MTFADWVRETRQRYDEQPLGPATRESAFKLRMGAQRRVDRFVGSPIWNRGDWDMLVIMDACRVDLYNEVAPEYDLPTTDGVWSNASSSIDWINRNFNGHPDDAARTAYVTGNPFADHNTPTSRSADLGGADMGHFVPLYRTHWEDLFDGQIATVTPETVTDHAIATWRDRDELGVDHLVAHYMQPHEPYRARPEWGSVDSKLLSDLVSDGEVEAGSSIWPALRDGLIDREEFWAVYKDNLRWVLDDVTERLLDNVDGRVVLTADHGNALGEWGEWHHPGGALSPGVRKVPWVGVNATDTETVIPDIRATEADTEAEEQLKALGYL